MARRLPMRLLSSLLFVGLIFAASVDAGRKKQPAKQGSLSTATSEELQLVRGDCTGDGGQDLANAQIVWRLQERRWFAGDSRARGEAPREDAQVFDCWEAGCGKARDPIGEVHSSYRKATREVIREVLTAKYARRGSGPRFAWNDR